MNTDLIFKGLQALDFFIMILMYALAYLTFWLAIMLPVPIWAKIKKMTDQEKKKAERIIVKMNDDIKKGDEYISAIDKMIKQREDRLKELEEREAELNKSNVESSEEVDKEAETVPLEKVENKEWSAIELRDLAKKRGIKNFSRMKKKELLKKLGIS